jgi:hypothetical protein
MLLLQIVGFFLALDYKTIWNLKNRIEAVVRLYISRPLEYWNYVQRLLYNILTVDTTILTTIRTIVVLLAAIATNMRDILAYAALILLMSQTDYHIFRISNARTYQPG